MNRRAALACLLFSSLPGTAARAARVVYDARHIEARTRAWFAEHGLVAGRNLELREEPLQGLAPEEMQARARAILASRPDAIVSYSWPSIFLYRRLTREIPLVFVNFGGDPVRLGLVESLRVPGGNVTGTCQQLMSMTPKIFELLKELRPSARRGAVLISESVARTERMVQGREEVARAASQVGIGIEFVVVPDNPSIAAVKSAIERSRIELLFVPDDLYGKPVMDGLIEYLKAARIPALYLLPEYVRKGGLISIAPDYLEGHRKAVEMVARIVQGEKPATIPVYQVTRYGIAINLGTARAMGLEISTALLTRADQVVD